MKILASVFSLTPLVAAIIMNLTVKNQLLGCCVRKAEIN